MEQQRRALSCVPCRWRFWRWLGWRRCTSRWHQWLRRSLVRCLRECVTDAYNIFVKHFDSDADAVANVNVNANTVAAANTDRDAFTDAFTDDVAYNDPFADPVLFVDAVPDFNGNAVVIDWCVAFAGNDCVTDSHAVFLSGWNSIADSNSFSSSDAVTDADPGPHPNPDSLSRGRVLRA